jgi:hypothetical protein
VSLSQPIIIFAVGVMKETLLHGLKTVNSWARKENPLPNSTYKSHHLRLWNYHHELVIDRDLFNSFHKISIFKKKLLFVVKSYSLDIWDRQWFISMVVQCFKVHLLR